MLFFDDATCVFLQFIETEIAIWHANAHLIGAWRINGVTEDCLNLHKSESKSGYFLFLFTLFR